MPAQHVFLWVDSSILQAISPKPELAVSFSTNAVLLTNGGTTSLHAGYGKMPGYEHVFTDFLLSLSQKEYKRRPSYSSGEW